LGDDAILIEEVLDVDLEAGHGLAIEEQGIVGNPGIQVPFIRPFPGMVNVKDFIPLFACRQRKANYPFISPSLLEIHL
jgi:hypothetical protein